MPQWQELNYCLPWSNLKIPTAWLDPNFSTPWSELNFSTPWLDPNFLISLSDPTSQHHGRTPTSTVCLNGPQSTPNWPFFSKSSNSQDHHFRAWRHSHSSPISYLGFIMTIVIVISFVHEYKTVPNVCAPELRAE